MTGSGYFWRNENYFWTRSVTRLAALWCWRRRSQSTRRWWSRWASVHVYSLVNRFFFLQAVDNGINIVSQDYSINWDYSQAGNGVIFLKLVTGTLWECHLYFRKNILHNLDLGHLLRDHDPDHHRVWPLRAGHHAGPPVLHLLRHRRNPVHALRDRGHGSDHRHPDDHHLGQVQAETRPLPREVQTKENKEKALGDGRVSITVVFLLFTFQFTLQPRENFRRRPREMWGGWGGGRGGEYRCWSDGQCKDCGRRATSACSLPKDSVHHHYIEFYPSLPLLCIP